MMIMRKVTVNCLGNLEVSDGSGLSIPIRSERSRALLACLAVERDNWTRERLSYLLWKNGKSHRARSNLRQQLLSLRHDLVITAAADWSQGDRVELPAQVGTDIELFREAVQRGDHATAVRTYRGDLFEDANIKNSVFQEWLAKWRLEFRQDACRSLLCLLRLSTTGPTERKLFAKRLITLDPTCEEAQQSLIHFYLDQGDVALAIEQYRTFAEALKSCGRTPSYQSSATIGRALGSLQPTQQALDSEGQPATWIAEINRQHDVAAPPNPRLMAPIQGRPSIAVLPFVDRGLGRFRNEVIADGLTEELAMALARVPGLFVTACQSSMVYKRSSLDVRRIAAELGVRYVLEGSVEIRGVQLRINVRLIDGETGLHIWAETFDREFVRFFEVRDEIIKLAASRLLPSLMLSEIKRALASETPNLDAWARLQRANGHILFKRRVEGLAQAIEELEQALAIEPDYAMAESLLSAVHTWRALWSRADASQDRAAAISYAARAREAAPRNPYVLANCADTALYSSGNIDLALELLSTAVSDGPEDPQTLALLANVRRVAGQEVSESLKLIEKAMRISPRDPRSHRWHHYAGWCFWKTGDLEAMEDSARRAIELYSDAPAQWIELVCALGLQGRYGEAREAAIILKRHLPDFTPQGFLDIARAFYGRRFPGEVERDYSRLCQTLTHAL
ncbi:BTAD domain-containing putative transcriptional regulator [Bradyrhizobium sp. C9]|uniref:BTAD domain-containing putative transcriptional regulator n=1 Tax=Bradyrhizobium sp. C9 TaxID=142585 RepID=UPI000BE9E2E3|nr:BTAD domain-containing putative transcriptional regulator [Bradyrhizobium sp. C9]PDT74296.1 hypothetical protein CO675_26340 [Bradyrhizobium sp. C9]